VDVSRFYSLDASPKNYPPNIRRHYIGDPIDIELFKSLNDIEKDKIEDPALQEIIAHSKAKDLPLSIHILNHSYHARLSRPHLENISINVVAGEKAATHTTLLRVSDNEPVDPQLLNIIKNSTNSFQCQQMTRSLIAPTQ
jgi:hypothetical protein